MPPIRCMCDRLLQSASPVVPTDVAVHRSTRSVSSRFVNFLLAFY